MHGSCSADGGHGICLGASHHGKMWCQGTDRHSYVCLAVCIITECVSACRSAGYIPAGSRGSEEGRLGLVAPLSPPEVRRTVVSGLATAPG